MTLATIKYVRKPFYIDAVQVTPENMGAVAEWCNGLVEEGEKGKAYIKVRVHRPMNDRQTQAFVGDWVLYAGTGYKVYQSKAFNNSFEPAKTEGIVGDMDESAFKG